MASSIDRARRPVGGHAGVGIKRWLIGPVELDVIVAADLTVGVPYSLTRTYVDLAVLDVGVVETEGLVLPLALVGRDQWQVAAIAVRVVVDRSRCGCR